MCFSRKKIDLFYYIIVKVHRPPSCIISLFKQLTQFERPCAVPGLPQLRSGVLSRSNVAFGVRPQTYISAVQFRIFQTQFTTTEIDEVTTPFDENQQGVATPSLSSRVSSDFFLPADDTVKYPHIFFREINFFAMISRVFSL